MNIIVLSDSFPPLKSAASGMIDILVEELSKNHSVFVFTASLDKSLSKENIFITNFLKEWRYQSNLKRIIFEIINAFILTFLIIKNKKKLNKIDLIIWYSPSSFLWIPVFFGKMIFKSKVVMILRDIFPDWLYHINLLNNKFIYKLLTLLAYPQYLVSNVIGSQTEGDKTYLINKGIKNKITVLQNWQSVKRADFKSKNEEITTKSFIKKVVKFKRENNGVILTYLGSTSAAQDVEQIFVFIKKLNKSNQKKIQINIFARDVKKVQKLFLKKEIYIHLNIWEQVSSDHISSILDYTDYGIVSLNDKHVTNNIPGKFVTYTQFSVPVICFANRGQDLTSLIEKYKCGYIFSSDDHEYILTETFENILKYDKKKKKELQRASQTLFNSHFNIKNSIKEVICNHGN